METENNFKLPEQPIFGQNNDLSLGDAVKLAMKLHGQGKFAEAENMARQIIAVDPKNPDAFNVLSLIAHNVGKIDLAIELLLQAIKNSSSKKPLYYSNCGEMYRSINNIEKAIEFGEKAVAAGAKGAFVFCNLALAYYDSGDLEKATELHEKALSINPNFANSLNNLASIERDSLNLEDAVDLYKKAINANPEYLEPYNNVGATLFQLNEYDEGLKYLEVALSKNPNYAEANCNKAFILYGMEDFENSMKFFNRALQLKPDYPEAFQGVAKIHQEYKAHELAEISAKHAVELAPNNADAYATLAHVYNEVNDDVKAKQNFEKALEINEDHVVSIIGLASFNTEDGKIKEAEALYRKALNILKKDKSLAVIGLINLNKVKQDSEFIAPMQELENKIETFPRRKAKNIHFALGKMYDDLKDADKAFYHFKAGGDIQRSLSNYSSDIQAEKHKTLKEIFTKEFINSLRGSGIEDATPIFVLGMPRSGTTLTEQIIASHPDVYGAGELNDLLELVEFKWWKEDGSKNFPDNMVELTPEKIKLMAEKYIERIRRVSSDSKHITDKMPANFHNVGLIHLMFPNAKIIHTKRHPLDTCLSCFSKQFKKGAQDHTYDLEDLGKYYLGYLDIMEHWRNVLPEGSFYESEYEELIADAEGKSKALIEYCKLEWDDKCLNFYKSKRKVKTASLTQVRQPIYKSSVARWEAYSEHLAPLKSVLADVL